jgi:hypothetical protein
VKKVTGFYPRSSVDTTGASVVSNAGATLLIETIRAVGLDRALSQTLAPWRPATAVHDPAKVVLDLAVTLAFCSHRDPAPARPHALVRAAAHGPEPAPRPGRTRLNPTPPPPTITARHRPVEPAPTQRPRAALISSVAPSVLSSRSSSSVSAASDAEPASPNHETRIRLLCCFQVPVIDSTSDHEGGTTGHLWPSHGRHYTRVGRAGAEALQVFTGEVELTELAVALAEVEVQRRPSSRRAQPHVLLGVISAGRIRGHRQEQPAPERPSQTCGRTIAQPLGPRSRYAGPG